MARGYRAGRADRAANHTEAVQLQRQRAQVQRNVRH
jgi:hypothetical protein